MCGSDGDGVDGDDDGRFEGGLGFDLIPALGDDIVELDVGVVMRLVEIVLGMDGDDEEEVSAATLAEADRVTLRVDMLLTLPMALRVSRGCH